RLPPHDTLVKIQSAFVILLYLAVPSLSPAQVEPPTSAGDTKQPSASELLTCSIAYHDPNGSWQQGAFKITDISSRPDGTTGRRTIVRLLPAQTPSPQQKGSGQKGYLKTINFWGRPEGTTGRRTIVRLHNGQGRFA